MMAACQYGFVKQGLGYKDRGNNGGWQHGGKDGSWNQWPHKPCNAGGNFG